MATHLVFYFLLPQHTHRQLPQVIIMDVISCAHEQQPAQHGRPGIRIHPTDKYSTSGGGWKEDRGSSAPQLACS